MPKRSFQLKPKTELTRLLLNSAIVISIFKNPELMEHICGPFTFPIVEKEHLIVYIIAVEVVRVCYRMLAGVSAKLPVLKWMPGYVGDMLTVKYLFVLVLKIVLIFEEQHRKKFYLHSFLLEGVILATAILFDCTHRDNIKEAGELLLIDGLHRLSLVYALTQTFCPNLILYYAISNLLIFVMGQAEAQYKYGLKQSLYVKHDVYRFMFMSMLFFGMSSLAQLSFANFKMLLTFLVCLKPLMTALQNYEESNFGVAVNYLGGTGVLLGVSELCFLGMPFSMVGDL